MRLAHLVLPAMLGFLLIGCSPDEEDRRDMPPADTVPPASTPIEPPAPVEPTPPAPTTAPESDMNTNPGSPSEPTN
jgi:hypothetical protein